MSKMWVRIISLLSVGIILGIFIMYQSGWLGQTTESKQNQAEQSELAKKNNKAPLVRGLRIQESSVNDQIQVTGSLLANEEVDLTSETAGRITSINFQEGQVVSKGSLLVKFNDAELQAQLKRLQAQVELYQNREFRQKKLLEKGGVSQDEYEGVLAELNALKAQVQETGALISKTEIRSPFTGTIGLRKVSTGSYITPGNPIVRLVNIQRLKLEFSVPEKYSQDIQVGQSILVSGDAMEETIKAKIYAIEPSINVETRTLTARAILPNPDRKLLPGAFVDIQLILKEFENAIEVPSVAVISELGGQKVFLYKGGKAIPRKVLTGIRGENKVQIIDGLQIGDTLISSGILNVRPNIEVRLQSVE